MVARLDVVKEQEFILPCRTVLFGGTCLFDCTGGQQTVALAFAMAALVAQSFASASILLMRPLSMFP